jgi:hypothetical protein
MLLIQDWMRETVLVSLLIGIYFEVELLLFVNGNLAYIVRSVEMT